MDQHLNLTEAQERALYATLAAKYGRPGSKFVEFSADEQLVWDTINDFLGVRRNLGDVLAKCGKEYTRATFADDVEAIMLWLDAGCGRPITRTQRLAIVTTAVECLGRQVGRGAPLTHKTLIQQLLKLPTALDRAFPGYQEARLLDRVAPLAEAA